MAGAASTFADDEDAMLTDINVTPLVDVVLVLLIVFMITIPAVVGAAMLKVDLPETGSAEAAVEQLSIDLTLRREASGEVVLYRNDNRTSQEELQALLDKLGGPPEEQPVSLAADKGIPYGEVVTVLDMLSAMGLKKLSLFTKNVNKP